MAKEQEKRRSQLPTEGGDADDYIFRIISILFGNYKRYYISLYYFVIIKNNRPDFWRA